MFDQYQNQYKDPELCASIEGEILVGQGNVFETTVAASGDYLINVRPVYPPKQFEFMVYFLEGGEKVNIIREPLGTIVDTYFDWTKTELHGEQVAGDRVDRDIQFDVLLRDTKEQCYEFLKEVRVTALGPYLDEDLDSQAPVQNKAVTPFALAVATQEDAESETCKLHYSVGVPANSLTQAGVYEIQVFIAGENSDLPVLRQRSLVMLPGQTHPAKTQLVVPSLQGRGNAPLFYQVNIPMLYSILLCDAFGNPINEEREDDSAELQTLGINGKSEISNLHNGTYQVETTIWQTGTIRFFKGIDNGFRVIVNNENMVLTDLDLLDFPQYIKLSPGPCTPKYPSNNIAEKTSQVFIGQTVQFRIQCKDDWNNNVVTGGDSFAIQLSSNTLENVGSDSIDSKVTDLNDGSYTVEFLISWAGTYELNIQAHDVYYSQTNVTAVSPQCPMDAPYFCANSQSCVAGSYMQCNLPQYTCADPDKPLACTVAGQDSCVTNKSECDCQEGFVKCLADNKCVESSLASDLCSTILKNSCEDPNYPYLCVDGSCRKTKQACPS